jgi:Uma2 family endonuclease
MTTTGNTETLILPPRKRWTREEFEHAIAVGTFHPESRLELIEGELVEQMTQNSPHATGVRLIDKLLNRVFQEGYDVRSQLPLVLGESLPEPDVAVVVGSPRDYALEHPETAVMIVEVSDTTLLYDRTTKAGLYARAGIPEYWILNLNDRVLEIHRQPAPMAEQPLGYHYRSITRHTKLETISLLAAPEAALLIADLLP